MRIGLLGMNHKTAELPLREGFAALCETLFFQKEFSSLPLVVLNTCNRSEIYFSSEDPLETLHTLMALIEKAAFFQGLELKGIYTSTGMNCFHHLARVVTGMDSLIIWETEIQGQVKQAYLDACHNQRVNRDLHFLFQKILKIGKDIRSLKSTSASLPSLAQAIQLALEAHRCPLENSKILFVGASHINRSLIHYFQEKGARSLALTNRTSKNFKFLSPLDSIEWTAWKNQLEEYDAVIFATKASNYLLEFEEVEANKKYPLLIDLSVPRNVDPRCSQLLNLDEVGAYLKTTKEIDLTSQLNHLLLTAVSDQLSIFDEKETQRLTSLVSQAS